MRLAAHQDRDSRRLCRRGGKHHGRRRMTVHDQRVETAGPDFAPKRRRNNRKEPGRLAAPFGAADEPRVVAVDEVDIPLDMAPETAIGAAPHRIVRKIKRGYAARPNVDSDAGTAARHTESDACAGSAIRIGAPLVMPALSENALGSAAQGSFA